MARFNPDTYVTVQERIRRFWADHPDGAIRTELMSPPDDFTACRYVARLYRHRDDPHPAATGWAFELAGHSPQDGANYTSHEENCETSAIGRAAANLGYVTTTEERPSREEMGKVARRESSAAAPRPERAAANASNGGGPPATEAQRRFLRGLAKDLGWTTVGPDGTTHHDEGAMVMEITLLTGKKFDDLTVGDANSVITEWKQRVASQRGDRSA